MGLLGLIFFGIAAVITLVLITFAALVILELLITSPIIDIVFILLLLGVLLSFISRYNRIRKRQPDENYQL